MRPGRELDTRIAREIFHHEVWATNKTLHERTPEGKRLLKPYSKEMEWATEVARKMRVTLLPLADGQWFAFVANENGWESPQAFVDFLQEGDFSRCGASMSEDAPLAICEAALRAVEKRAAAELSADGSTVETEGSGDLLAEGTEPAQLH
jgi:hypothetical protein